MESVVCVQIIPIQPEFHTLSGEIATVSAGSRQLELALRKGSKQWRKLRKTQISVK